MRARFARAPPGCRGRFPGFTKVPQDRTETRIKLKVLGGLVARSGVFFAPPEKSTFMAGPRKRHPERLVCQKFKMFFAEVSICPGTVKLLQKSLRETHFEATATRFEFPWQIRRKSRISPETPPKTPPAEPRNQTQPRAGVLGGGRASGAPPAGCGSRGGAL